MCATLGEFRRDRIRDILVCVILDRDDARKRRPSTIIRQAHNCVLCTTEEEIITAVLWLSAHKPYDLCFGRCRVTGKDVPTRSLADV